MIDAGKEMMKYFGMLLKGTFDYEETYYFTIEEQIMRSIVDKKGYLIIDCKKGEFDKEKQVYSMTVFYMSVQAMFI